MPRLIELFDEGRLPDDLRIVGISTAVSPDRPNFPPSQWFVDKEWPFEVMADGVDFDAGTFVAAEAYGVTGFPFTVMLDTDGTVLDRWSGETTKDELESKINDALGR